MKSQTGKLMQSLSSVLFLLASGPALLAAEPAANRLPNIVFAMADDWAWPHAPAYGDKVVKTPTFDRVVKDGMLFTHAFSVSPSCTASRSAVLTGQWAHRLEESGDLWSQLQMKFPCYPDILEAAGYHVGLQGKGWGPGSLEGTGRTRNPAGPNFKDFETFFKTVPEGKPFCFWLGHRDPHRAYVKGTGVQSGMKIEDVFVPPYLPDMPEVRGDICDYYFAVQRYDRDTGEIVKVLEKAGVLDNTIIIMTGDNGWPFPRAKANLYDSGTRQPLAIRWPARIKAGTTSDAMISFQDFAPTILEAVGLKPSPEMTGRSFFDELIGEPKIARDRVFVERERHAYVRKDGLGYPARAIRTREFLYIRNFHPERWPAGDPPAFGDIDDGPSKRVVVSGKDDPTIVKFFQMACGKRPAEELFDVVKDPYQLTNLADRAEYAETKKKLSDDLDRWMRDTLDPRAKGDNDRWDKYPYFGPGLKKK